MKQEDNKTIFSARSTGSITLYLGPMFSGKSTELIREYRRWTSIKKSVLMINHKLDHRYGDIHNMSTHDQVSIPCSTLLQLADLDPAQLQSVEAIFINEGQFFSDLKETCLIWCEDFGKHLFICGLDGDCFRQSFGQMLDLIPYATMYYKLTAKCQLCLDGTDAPFTLDTLLHDKQIKVGNDHYLPVCRRHYLDLRAEKPAYTSLFFARGHYAEDSRRAKNNEV